MSLKKSATRRLGLLAGSSLVAASLMVTTFTTVALAPSSAFAANECNPVGVDPNANGAAADTRTCSGATTYQTSGVTYTTEGNLTVTTSGNMNVGSIGINLIGEGVDNITFSSGNTVTGTGGATIDITTASGNITATSLGVVATTAGMTNAVRLESTGAGNITFTKTGGFPGAAINNSAEGAEAAVAASTNGGNILLNINSSVPQTTGVPRGINGRLRGILAETNGAGGVTLNVTGESGVQASQVDGIAAVDIVAGTGGVNINLSGLGVIGGRQPTILLQEVYIDALALRVASAAPVSVLNSDGAVIGAVDFSGVTAGGVTFQNLGTGIGLNLAGYAEINGGAWAASGHSIFTAQNDLLVMAGARANVSDIDTSIDFGGGVDTFNMSGVLTIQGMTITNLEAFNNSGAIWFGHRKRPSSSEARRTDGHADDVLTIAGTTFTGSGASRLVMDVILGGVSQADCETLTGAADCFDLRGSMTAGSTMVSLTDSSEDARLSGYVPGGITLIDVAGGTTGASHFTLDPASTNGYVNPLYGPAIDRPGAFVYIFRYDEENQRFLLVSQPRSRDLFEYGILSGAAQSIWHMTAETVTDRQGELRRGSEGGSLWLRTSGEYTKRDIATAFEAFDGPMTFDNGYKLYAGTIIGGMDLLAGRSGGYDYALGGQAGYVGSSLELSASETNGKFTGATGGLYASVWSDGLFIDAAFNLNGLSLDYVSPSLGSKTTTYVNSVGGRIDGGMRWVLGEQTFLEPLATLAFARTSFEEISLAPGEVELAVANSRRGALGLRFGTDLTQGPLNVGYFVTGRGWNEFAGETDGVVHNPGVDLPFSDAFSGGFGEAEAGVSFFNDDGTLSGYLSSGVKFKDGYSATDLSLGLRARW